MPESLETDPSFISDNIFNCLENICGYCNCLNYACPETVSEEKRCENNDSVNDITYSSHNHSEIHFKAVADRNTITDYDTKRNNVSGNTNLKHPNVLKGSDLNESFKVQSSSKSRNQSDTLSFNLMPKGLNCGHLNIQGSSGKSMCKFSETKAISTSPENSSLHIFGFSETKLKPYKLSTCFDIDGFQAPFRKDNDSNGCGGIIVYVRNGINAKRRVDLETYNIACIWLEITVGKSKPFLIGNIYRPPDSKI